MITLQQLEYIVAIDTYRHFVTASEKCFVTQPTLSMQIKKLEDHLGVTIFDRSKQPIVPTEIGVKIIQQARITLSESKKINEIIAEYEQKVSGELVIGIIPSLAPYLLPLFISNFTSKYQELKLKVIELLSEEIIERLEKDLIDVGILVTPLHENGIIEKPLFYEKMVLYANKNHQLAKKKNLTTSHIASPDLWLLSNGHCFRNQVVNLCSYQIKEDLPFEYDSGSLETLKKIVDKDGGFTLIPELAIDDPMSNHAVVKTFTDVIPVREVSLVYSRTFVKNRLINLLGECIKNAVPQELWETNGGEIVEWRM